MLGSLLSRVIPQIGRVCAPRFHLSSNILRPAGFLSNPMLFRPSLTLQQRVKNPFEQVARHMANHRHKKYISLAKGYRGRANRCYKVARMRVEKGRQYAYRDRKIRRRDIRKLWIQRINAASRMYGVTYNSFTCRLLRSGSKLNRKVLSELAVTEPLSFKSVVDVVKTVKI